MITQPEVGEPERLESLIVVSFQPSLFSTDVVALEAYAQMLDTARTFLDWMDVRNGGIRAGSQKRSVLAEKRESISRCRWC